MQTRSIPTCPRVSAGSSSPKRPWDIFCLAATTSLLTIGVLGLAPSAARADRLRLVEHEGGNEVEVLEERPEGFVVKIPKSEVELVTRETPTDIKLWKDKKILWEDQGDYLVISLPKERIAPPPTTTAEGTAGYTPAASLEEGLTVTGVKGQHSAIGILTGNVTGRVLQHGRPLRGCRVRLVPIQGPATELTRLLGSKASQGPGQNVVEASTGTNGIYLFEEVPIGDYDISWLPPGSTHWLGWLSDKPDVTVRAGAITQQSDAEL